MDQDAHSIAKRYKLVRENAIVAQTNNVVKPELPSAMKIGTLNLVDKEGNTLGSYQFRNGGGGRGHIPPGTYIVTGREGLAPTDVRPMTVGNVGYKYRVRNASGSTQIADPRYPNAPREGILIHPDGNYPGTAGCIGIVGDQNIQKDFMQKMDSLIQQGGGQYVLKFDDSSTAMPQTQTTAQTQPSQPSQPSQPTGAQQDGQTQQTGSPQQATQQTDNIQNPQPLQGVYTFGGRVLTPAQAAALGPFAQVSADPNLVSQGIKYGL